MTSREIGYWKGKYSCPICDKFIPNEDWFVVNHMADNHSAYQLASSILDLLSRAVMKETVFTFKPVNGGNRNYNFFREELKKRGIMTDNDCNFLDEADDDDY